jgi:hypothetical protein
MDKCKNNILSAKNWTIVLILFHDKIIVKRCFQYTRIKLGILTCLLCCSYRQLQPMKHVMEYQIKPIYLPWRKIKCLRDHHASCVCVSVTEREREAEMYTCVFVFPSITSFKAFITLRFSINSVWMSLHRCCFKFPTIGSNKHGETAKI